MDATYKITVLGYPLLIIGTQDIEHRFRPIAMALSKHERQKYYEFILRNINAALEKYYCYSWKVDFVMGDASESIYNASIAVFGNSHRHGMCSVHVFRNVEKKIASFVPTKFRKDLRSDLKFLENLPSTSLFEAGIKLFEEKWEGRIPEFLDYFFNEWIDSKFCYWYRGAIPVGFSHTNNGIEAFNSSIKKKYTNWERLHFQDFLSMIKNIIHDHSEKSTSTPFPVRFHNIENFMVKSS